MRTCNWTATALAILGSAVFTAIAAAALPDNPYQRWQLVAGTLYDNARWSYERIHFDPAPVDVAIIGSSRSQFGLSAPRIAERLAALGHPAAVANMSIIEDGRNIEWAIADELFRNKHPKILVVLVNEDFNRWGHPGFKYVAPVAAVAWPPAPLLHNSLYDIAYLPFRQLKLFAARVFPAIFGLHPRFDPERYAATPTDFTVTRTLPDGKLIDMNAVHSPDELRAEAAAFALSQKPSLLPGALTAITDADNPVYMTRIARLAEANGARLIFVFLPKFESSAVIEGRAFYDRLGMVEDYGDLSRNATLYQSFAHLNHAGATIASDRVASAAARMLAAPATDGYVAGPGAVR